MSSKTICFVTISNKLKYCFNVVFLFQSFLIITVLKQLITLINYLLDIVFSSDVNIHIFWIICDRTKRNRKFLQQICPALILYPPFLLPFSITLFVPYIFIIVGWLLVIMTRRWRYGILIVMIIIIMIN